MLAESVEGTARLIGAAGLIATNSGREVNSKKRQVGGKKPTSHYTYDVFFVFFVILLVSQQIVKLPPATEHPLETQDGQNDHP